MLEEPYRWVEAINNRREYVEDSSRAVVRGGYDVRRRGATADGYPRPAQAL